MENRRSNHTTYNFNTQEETIEAISSLTGKSKTWIRAFVHSARESRYLWDEFITDAGNLVIVGVERKKMFFAIFD